MQMFETNPQIGTMHFVKADIVRNPLIIEIEEEFEKWEDSKVFAGKASGTTSDHRSTP